MKIKLLVLSLLAICFFTVSSFAAGVGLDFKGGLNLATYWGDDVPSDEAVRKAGAVVGAGACIKLGKVFVIQTELLFSMKGSNAEYEIEDWNNGNPITLDAESKIKLTYLEIPVLFKFSFPAGPVLPNFYVGPAISFLLGAKVSFDDGTDDSYEDEDHKELYRGIDFGLAMGGGLDIKAGPGRVILEFRYTFGFLNVMETIKILDEEITTEARNTVLSIILGYGIDFGSK